MDTLWTIAATIIIVVIGIAITIFVIHPIRNLQRVRSHILKLLVDYADVYGIAKDNRKYQARDEFLRSILQLEQARVLIPWYWLWGALWLVPKQKKLDEVSSALRTLSTLAVQIIDHQADLTRRRAEREQAAKEAVRQEQIIKTRLRLKKYEIFNDP